MSDFDFDDDTIGNFASVGTFAAQNRTASELRSLSEKFDNAQSQAQVQQERQEYLFQVNREVERINALYTENPCQAYYDSLVLEHNFKSNPLDTSHVHDLNWKNMLLEIETKIPALVQHGATQIDPDSRHAAVGAYNEWLAKAHYKIQKQQEHLLQLSQKSARSSLLFWMYFAGIVAPGVGTLAAVIVFLTRREYKHALIVFLVPTIFYIIFFLVVNSI